MQNLLNMVRGRWQVLSGREQRLIIVMTALLFVALFFAGMVTPLQHRMANSDKRIQAEKSLLTWVQHKADHILALRQQRVGHSTSQSLNQVIMTTADQSHIVLIRSQPGGNTVQVWVQPVKYLQLTHWLAQLKTQFDVDVDALRVERAEQPGMVEVKRLQFKQG